MSHNNISDIEPLKNFKNLKKVDLSFNKINNINELKSISKYNNKIEKLYLNNNDKRCKNSQSKYISKYY